MQTMMTAMAGVAAAAGPVAVGISVGSAGGGGGGGGYVPLFAVLCCHTGNDMVRFYKPN